jgi:hydroxycarboxylate dehydrogenase B
LLERGGAHLTFGEHKGFSLMLACEILGRVVTGAVDDRQDPIRDPLFRRAGTLIIAIPTDLFRPRSEYQERMEELAQRVRACPPGPGTNRVRLPGDPEREARECHRNVLTVPAALWTELERLAGVGGRDDSRAPACRRGSVPHA